VSLEAFITLDFSTGRHSKPFGRSSVGLDFRHINLLFSLDNLLGRKQHRHVPPFQTRLDIHFGNVLYLLDHFAQRLPAQLWVSNLAPSKKNRNFDSLALLDKLPDVTDLVFNVMRVRARSHFNFFDFNHGVLFRSVSLFPLLVPELPVVHHTADRRLSFWRDFDQV
jgi:hypothetical protein